MTEGQTLYNNVAPLRNVVSFAALVERVQRRDHGLPGLACYYGPSGFGKTTAGTYVANKADAYQVQVKSAWTAKKLCISILTEMSIKARGSVADMVDQVSEQLALTGRPLLIDEADFLVDARRIEIVRDIYEGSLGTIILIGEELLPQKLQLWERVHGRMLDWVAAEPADIGDVGHLARIYCRDVTITPDLQQMLLTSSAGSIRRICVNLARMRELATVNGLDLVDIKAWGRNNFFTGAPPNARRGIGEPPVPLPEARRGAGTARSRRSAA